MSARRIAVAVVGVLVALVAAGLIASGGGLLLAYGTQRTTDGFFISPTAALSTDSYALTSAEIDLGSRPGAWFASGRLATVRLEVETHANTPVFVGIGPDAEVDAFLEDVAHAEVTGIGPDPGDITYRTIPGDAPSAAPAEQTFWAASAQGVGTQTLTWDLEKGEWTVVIMNGDATPRVMVEASAGAKADLLIPVAVGLLLVGLILATVAAVLLVVVNRRSGQGTPMTATARDFGPYPVRLEGRLDPNLSRWQWLVKWLLAIPHYVILFFLWLAFALLTLVAWFAILFTGRYPRSIFEFNVGVMRWTWRVSYYSYSALGTDQYPPFTLAETNHPASLDVAYPERLSRGLALVKWWLLAIPHYLIIGLFTSGILWSATQINVAGNGMLEIGGGLIGILVLVSAVALAFTGRYPQGIFDLVMGLNRWCYRVLAYAALMRDEYPPFRLDTGGSEPGTTPPSSPTGPIQGGDVPTRPDLSRV